MGSPLINVSMCTVTATYVATDGQPMSGTVTLTPAALVILDPDTNTVIAPTPMVFNLDDAGTFTASIPATDDPDLNPTNWTYTVFEDLLNTEGSSYQNTYSIAAPSDGTVDLASAMPMTSFFGDAILRGPQGPPGDSPGIIDGGDADTVFALELDGGGA